MTAGGRGGDRHHRGGCREGARRLRDGERARGRDRALAAELDQHAGLPWELGLAETHQVLVRNRLRDRVVLRNRRRPPGRPATWSSPPCGARKSLGSGPPPGRDRLRHGAAVPPRTPAQPESPPSARIWQSKVHRTPETVVALHAWPRTSAASSRSRPSLRASDRRGGPLDGTAAAATTCGRPRVIARLGAPSPTSRRRIVRGGPIAVRRQLRGRCPRRDRGASGRGRDAGAAEGDDARPQPRRATCRRPPASTRAEAPAARPLRAHRVGRPEPWAPSPWQGCASSHRRGQRLRRQGPLWSERLCDPRAEGSSQDQAIAGNVCLSRATGGALHLVGRAGMRFAIRNSGARRWSRDPAPMAANT